MSVRVQYVSVQVQYIDIYNHINIHFHIHIHIYETLHHISVWAQYISVRAHPHHSTCARNPIFTLLMGKIFTVITNNVGTFFCLTSDGAWEGNTVA